MWNSMGRMSASYVCRAHRFQRVEQRGRNAASFLDVPVTKSGQPHGHLFVTSQRLLVLPLVFQWQRRRLDILFAELLDVIFGGVDRSIFGIGAPSTGVGIVTATETHRFSAFHGPRFMGGFKPEELFADVSSALARAGWSPRPVDPAP